MAFLYEKMDVLRENGYTAERPAYISENLNPNFELRPYQKMAFENFITHYESRNCPKPTQVLFHMATGSGKTLIMAGLMLYLYKQGYRNFLFFVNLSNIVEKTKENFLNAASSKYLFADEIVLDGERIRINQVDNFQYAERDAINICFATTQGLHMDMWLTRENGMSFDDFDNQKVVLISDEAHHLNVDTKKMSAEEESSYHSWEQTVKNIFERNSSNVLLEFTATCDLENHGIRAAYENKIIFDYSLSKFRADGYSKEIKTLRSDLDIEDRALQALILSQYRQKVFQAYRLNIKPVVFFKSKYVKDNAANMKRILEITQSLSGAQIQRVFDLATAEIMLRVRDYFISNGISYDSLATELRDDFSEEHCISANDEIEQIQIILNTLEDKDNPFRAVFAVDKLNEGWDVLNLFDIVRLYDTRDGKDNVPGKTTIKEAQLIGRGARYCPFKVDPEQDRFKRKYDLDVDNPLRVCEELYYHCWNEPRYISELHTALRGIGLDLENTIEIQYTLKEEFKEDSLYKEGLVFLNKRVEKSKTDNDGLLPSIRDRIYPLRIATGQSGEDILLEEGASTDSNVTNFSKNYTIAEIAGINYAIVHKAISKYPILKFDALKRRFPDLKSMREFVTSPSYLGSIKIQLTSRYEAPSMTILYNACLKVLSIIAEAISKIEKSYEGSKEFKPEKIRNIFKNKKCTYNNINEQGNGRGISQNDRSVPVEWKIDLSQEDWFAFEDNFGTSEEKAFVAYFKTYVPQLKAKYDKVYLLRNERQMHIYSFEGGERFEPDYLLFLHSPKIEGYEQLQVFIEPKGSLFIETDKWKEDFLLEIEGTAIPTKIFVDDNDYKIWGFHFFNQNDRQAEFDADMNRLL
ncbi:MAG: DEAD/DEAH box helicase family protein [Oscillospiraceae bacterium]|nr:DEAD/DEAH box helicase family protein [Oscillospiraceae bacterium]